MAPANLMDGRAIARQLQGELVQRIAALKAIGVQPGLAFVRVGEDPASKVYVGRKEKTCAELGVLSETHVLPEGTSEAELLGLVGRLNADPRWHGILVQAPLPSHIRSAVVYAIVRPEKDVDGFHPINVGKLMLGDPTGFLPCTPAGIVELLAAHRVPVEGRHVVVIGRGLTIGRPLALLLAMRRPGCNAAVTVVHTGVDDMAGLVRQADVIVAAAGVAGLVTPDMVKPGAAVVGAGTSWEGKRLMSDVQEDVAEVAGWITPRIGGVGPMTRAMLLRNAVSAAERVA